MNNALKSVEKFMEAADQTVRYTPVTQLPVDEIFPRLHLINEQFEAVRESLGVNDDGFGWSLYEPRRAIIPARVLQDLTDLLYVVMGTYLSLGLGAVAQQAFDEVHKSNMSKLVDGKFVKSPTGKILKGPNYSAPDFTKILNADQTNSVFK